MIKPFLIEEAYPINKYWESFPVPWLALACDAESLEESINQNPRLGSLNIAGLIPHAKSNDSLDATVVKWAVKLARAKREEVMLLEFKARRESYSANEGLEDLKEKVDNHYKGYPSKRLWTILHLDEEVKTATRRVECATEITRSVAIDELNSMSELLAKRKADSEAMLLENEEPASEVNRVCLLLGISGAPKSDFSTHLYERIIDGKVTRELHLALIVGCGLAA
jgi:hypothetical protein